MDGKSGISGGRGKGLPRRAFLGGLGAAGLATASGLGRALGQVSGGGNRPTRSGGKPEVCIFSKHLAWLDCDRMAATAKEIGFDGIDLAVRPGGHVLPERVEEDLPRAVEAAKKAGLKISKITTAITDAREPGTEAIIRTMSRLGIPYYRMGYYHYPENKSIPDYLAELAPQVRDLAAMSASYGVAGAYQNHSGPYLGAPIWDWWYLIRDIDPAGGGRGIGFEFDIGHVTAEGGYGGWEIDSRLSEPWWKTLVVKDFRWAKDGDGQWQPAWCPLGEGMIPAAGFLRLVKESGFDGPISTHFEYELGGKTEQEKQAALLKAMRSDLKVLRGWLKQSGLG